MAQFAKEQGTLRYMRRLPAAPTMAAEGEAMKCKSCTSENQLNFGAELNIHFSGREGLDKPAVWLFPTLLVCMDCGFTEFAIAENELGLLASGVRKIEATSLQQGTEESRSS